MRSMQQLILDKLDQCLASNEELAMLQSTIYANQGHLYVQHELHTLLELAYDFQTASCRIIAHGVERGELPIGFTIANVTGEGDAVFASTSAGSQLVWHSLKYHDGERISRMLQCLQFIVAHRHKQYQADLEAGTSD